MGGALCAATPLSASATARACRRAAAALEKTRPTVTDKRLARSMTDIEIELRFIANQIQEGNNP